jgi:hypothetical protein
VARTAIIHIGTRKTGTTSIQEALASAGDCLGSASYPIVGMDKDQNRIISLYIPPHEMPLAWQGLDRDLNDKFKKVFFRQLGSKNDLIISAEALSSWFSLNAIQRLRSDLEAAEFHRVFIVLYIRDPADYFLSFTQQVIKSTSIAAPLGEKLETFKYPFRSIAEKWESVFPDGLIVRRYSNPKDGGIVRDFSVLLKQLLDIDVPTLSSMRNTSLSAEGMKILQDYRLIYSEPKKPGVLTSDAQKLRDFLTRSLELVRQTKAVLRPEIAQFIRASHKKDADYMLDRYGLDLGSLEWLDAGVLVQSNYLVGDIVESYDDKIIEELLLYYAKLSLGFDPTIKEILLELEKRVLKRLARFFCFGA